VTPSIRPATPEDVPALVEIEEESFTQPHWTADDFRKDDCTVAEIEGRVVGFLVSRQTFRGKAGDPPEHEILNVAVSKSFRRRGIATHLLRHELARGGAFFLEVRESNAAAQALYRTLGFAEIGRRPYYYQHPEETAIVMNMK
jgi:ribosomal-protein-alanine acetyltransferase